MPTEDPAPLLRKIAAIDRGLAITDEAIKKAQKIVINHMDNLRTARRTYALERAKAHLDHERATGGAMTEAMIDYHNMNAGRSEAAMRAREEWAHIGILNERRADLLSQRAPLEERVLAAGAPCMKAADAPDAINTEAWSDVGLTCPPK